MKKLRITWWKVLLGALGAVLLAVLVYVAYFLLSYYRIADDQPLEISGAAGLQLPAEQTFTIATYNIGFGAYDPEFSFFMDGGKESVAKSKENVLKNTAGVLATLRQFPLDFLFAQEVDLNATRSWHVNQYELFQRAFGDFSSTIAIAYDSPYILYPFTRPHGKSLSGIATLSKYKMENAVRFSLPIADDFSKFVDLDRCYSRAAVPVNNGKTLYLYNAHLSAYTNDPEITRGQIKKLFGDMEEKLAAGDYVLCGGDFNHDLWGDSVALLNGPEAPRYGWTQPFPLEELADEISFAGRGDELVPTVRNCDKPYVPGETYIAAVDGFFISSNIECIRVQNVNAGFLYSDHNPVIMEFRLQL